MISVCPGPASQSAGGQSQLQLLIPPLPCKGAEHGDIFYLVFLFHLAPQVPKPARNTPYSMVEAVGSLVHQEQNLLGHEDNEKEDSEEEEQGYTSLAARPIVTRQQEASLPAQR